VRMGLQCEWVFSSYKQQSPVNWINRVIIYIYIYMYRVFILKFIKISTKISEESPLYREVPSY
jgi:hypothetical protein